MDYDVIHYCLVFNSLFRLWWWKLLVQLDWNILENTTCLWVSCCQCCEKKGGLEYKASIADAIIAIIEHNPDSKEAGLYRLCEFIEFPCEHNSLAVRILHLLGREGPRTKKPSKYNPFSFFRHHLIELTTNIKSIFNIGLGFVQLLIFQTVNGGYFKK